MNNFSDRMEESMGIKSMQQSELSTFIVVEKLHMIGYNFVWEIDVERVGVIMNIMKIKRLFRLYWDKRSNVD